MPHVHANLRLLLTPELHPADARLVNKGSSKGSHFQRFPDKNSVWQRESSCIALCMVSRMSLWRQRLQNASDADLQLYLLQLVQALYLSLLRARFSRGSDLWQALRYEPPNEATMESEA